MKGTNAQVTSPRIAVPAYIHPEAYAGDWDTVLATDPVVLPFVVANVANGPAERRDEGWAGVMGRARRQGIAVLGYVDTGYLGRAETGYPHRSESGWLAAVAHDVAAWHACYGDDMGGIFFDRVHGTADAAPLYRRLGDEVRLRRPASLVVLNPGGVVPAGFEHAGDVLVTFEGPLDRYRGSGPSAGELDWTPGDAASVLHLVYGVPAGAIDEVVARSRRRHAGLVYVTDQSLPNPWGRLTTHWEHLVEVVRGPGVTNDLPGDPLRPA